MIANWRTWFLLCISPVSLPASPSRPPAPFWLWPHLLSLEAPLVAVAWTWALSKMHDATIMPGVLSGLALAVWIIYVADRLFDTVGVPAESLDVRHAFYRRHRGTFMVALVVALGFLIYNALWVVPAGLMWQCVALGLLMLLYLGIYSASGTGRGQRWVVHLASLATVLFLQMLPLPPTLKFGATLLIVGLLVYVQLGWVGEGKPLLRKEFAGGLLFALGCSAWTRFSAGGGGLIAGAMEIALMAGLFTCNLLSITQREEEAAGHPQPVRLANSGLIFTVFLAAWCVFAMRNGQLPLRSGPLVAATGLGVSLLAGVHGFRARMSPSWHRVLADVAVVAPVLMFLR